MGAEEENDGGRGKILVNGGKRKILMGDEEEVDRLGNKVISKRKRDVLDGKTGEYSMKGKERILGMVRGRKIDKRKL